MGTALASGATVEDQADPLAALLDILEIRQAALLSYSSGGPVAYSLAARHPSRVLALVAISSVSGPHLLPETGAQSGVVGVPLAVTAKQQGGEATPMHGTGRTPTTRSHGPGNAYRLDGPRPIRCQLGPDS